MAKRKGFYWHVHHDELMEYCWDYEGRVDFIRRNKPSHEIEPRVGLMQPVRGKLPEALIKAAAAYYEAQAAYQKAETGRAKAWAAYEAPAAWENARAAFDKAWAAWENARAAFEKALRAHMPEIEALHAQECPNCPWDGKYIHFE